MPKTTSKRRRHPWEKPAPKRKPKTKLTRGQKSKAKAAAKRAGRPYPNLVDNMRAASKRRKRKAKS